MLNLKAEKARKSRYKSFLVQQFLEHAAVEFETSSLIWLRSKKKNKYLYKREKEKQGKQRSVFAGLFPVTRS